MTIFVIPPQSGLSGPLLDSNKVANLPEAFGPGPMHRVLRESVSLGICFVIVLYRYFIAGPAFSGCCSRSENSI